MNENVYTNKTDNNTGCVVSGSQTFKFSLCVYNREVDLESKHESRVCVKNIHSCVYFPFKEA